MPQLRSLCLTCPDRLFFQWLEVHRPAMASKSDQSEGVPGAMPHQSPPQPHLRSPQASRFGEPSVRGSSARFNVGGQYCRWPAHSPTVIAHSSERRLRQSEFDEPVKSDKGELDWWSSFEWWSDQVGAEAEQQVGAEAEQQQQLAAATQARSGATHPVRSEYAGVSSASLGPPSTASVNSPQQQQTSDRESAGNSKRSSQNERQQTSGRESAGSRRSSRAERQQLSGRESAGSNRTEHQPEGSIAADERRLSLQDLSGAQHSSLDVNVNAKSHGDLCLFLFFLLALCPVMEPLHVQLTMLVRSCSLRRTSIKDKAELNLLSCPRPR